MHIQYVDTVKMQNDTVKGGTLNSWGLIKSPAEPNVYNISKQSSSFRQVSDCKQEVGSCKYQVASANFN